jgi:amino acid transporter
MTPSTGDPDALLASSPNATQEKVPPKAGIGNGYVRIRYDSRTKAPAVEEAEEPIHVLATELPTTKPSGFQRLISILVGSPISSENAIHERIGVVKALAVLSSDALSSVAYGTEASLSVLVAAGLAVSSRNVLIGGAIILLLALVATSYRQTIFHYPNGGGSYIVAKDNLNVHFGLVAAAALLIDYVLTVSVSVASGVDALASTFAALKPWSVPIGLVLIVFIMVVNLRGVRESGSIFAIPTYVFVASFLLMIGLGLARAIIQGGLFHPLPPGPTQLAGTEHLTWFLLLSAFARGCTAMTGTEAISNGVPIFRAPQSQNAARTLTLMALLLGTMYGGTTFLAWRFGISPQPNQQPTLITQMAQMLFTGPLGWFFYIFQFATLLILVLAANTSFADFPRLSSILSKDEYLPHMFGAQGDRLAFNTGIIVLGVLSSILLAIFDGRTDALLNLYALGVFIAFTLSQSGMVMRWIRKREPGWHGGLTINLLGATATAAVAVIIAITKFLEGAWLVVILIPAFYLLFEAIHRHYARVRQIIDTMEAEKPEEIHPLIVVPVATLNALARRGLAYARSITPRVVAVHVSIEEKDAEAIRRAWDELLYKEHFLRGGPSPKPIIRIEDELFQDDDLLPDEDRMVVDAAPVKTTAPAIRSVSAPGDVTDPTRGKIAALLASHPIDSPELFIIDSPYRAIARPIINFLDTLQAAYPNDLITVVLPEFVPQRFWESILHNQSALRLKFALLLRPKVVTTNVPYHSQ